MPSRISPSRRIASDRLGAGGDDADEVAEGRVAELAPALQLGGEEALDVVAGGEADGLAVGLEGLDHDAPGSVAAAAPGELGQKLEGALLGAEVRLSQTRVGIDHGGQRDAGEVVALGDHLRAEQNGAVGRGEAGERLGERARARGGCRRRGGSAPARGIASASSRSSFCVPAPMRESSGEPQAGQTSGSGSA